MSADLGVTGALAEYVAGLTYEQVPAQVIHAAKRAILDSIGCSIGGGRTDPGRVILQFFEEMGGRPDTHVLASGRRLPILNGVYVNAALANLLDVDDSLGEGHLGATVVPPAVSACGLRPATGRDLLTAVVGGYEVSARVGTAIRPSPRRFREVRGLGTFQVFGAAAAVGRLLGLDASTLTSAFGIAGANAPVPSVYKEGIGERPVAWVKNNFGWAAEGGVLGVLLASRGFRGQRSFLDGEKGFWQMAGSDQCDFEEMISGLGREYRILSNSFKPYSCCRYHHTAIDAIRALAQDPVVASDGIQSIHVRAIWRVSEHMNTAPADLIDAQYSLPYQLAAHLLGKADRFDWMLTTSLSDPEILSMGARVTYEFDEEHERRFLAERTAGSTVVISRSDASRTVTATYAWGSPNLPISDGDLERKFLHLAGPTVGDRRARALADVVWNLESVRDVDGALRQLFDVPATA